MSAGDWLGLAPAAPGESELAGFTGDELPMPREWDEEFPRASPAGESRRVHAREDGELGEPVVFALGPDGQVSRMVRHSNPYPKVR